MIDFETFLQEVRGHAPYPWQSALAAHLGDETAPLSTSGDDDQADEPDAPRPGNAPAPVGGPPPLTVAVPTGSGKTTVVDVLVWALAKQADRPPLERTVGARIVWAIDRRLLVDEVHEQTERLTRKLAAALVDPTTALHEVAVRLEGLKGTPPVGGWAAATGASTAAPTVDRADASALPDAGDPDAVVDPALVPEGVILRGQPLVATRWRGGVMIPSLGQHPMQAEVITSTVAQIGSRLLFRGYGLGDRSLPLGAALSTCDTTICLDEAHLAEPFADTVQAIRQRRHDSGDTFAPPLRLIRLSATSGVDDGALRVELLRRRQAGQGPEGSPGRAQVRHPGRARRHLRQRPGGRSRGGRHRLPRRRASDGGLRGQQRADRARGLRPDQEDLREDRGRSPAGGRAPDRTPAPRRPREQP